MMTCGRSLEPSHPQYEYFDSGKTSRSATTSQAGITMALYSLFLAWVWVWLVLRCVWTVDLVLFYATDQAYGEASNCYCNSSPS